jgi:hypothetical protein
MDDKPKTALDWIQWARRKKGDTNTAAPPAEPPAAPPAAAPAKPVPSPWESPAASAEPVVSEPAPVQEPPALPTDETAGCGASDEDFADLEDPEELESLPDLDDFDRLMADIPLAEPSDDPAPTPQADKP